VIFIKELRFWINGIFSVYISKGLNSSCGYLDFTACGEKIKER
jgi:hypothetical protein